MTSNNWLFFVNWVIGQPTPGAGRLIWVIPLVFTLPVLFTFFFLFEEAKADQKAIQSYVKE